VLFLAALSLHYELDLDIFFIKQNNKKMQKIVIVVFTVLALVLFAEGFGRGPRKQVTDADQMMKSKTGAGPFYDYAKRQYNEENLDFLKDSGKALNTWKKKTLQKRVNQLTQDYGKTSPRQVNLDEHVALERLQQPGLSKAQLKQGLQESRNFAKGVVNFDTLAGFKGTPQYHDYINRRN
jgi:hypothetical protein